MLFKKEINKIHLKIEIKSNLTHILGGALWKIKNRKKFKIKNCILWDLHWKNCKKILQMK
jgi:hypothetical protein